jgi:heme/copper-type cytochrome/quinol oxidase subunit 1
VSYCCQETARVCGYDQCEDQYKIFTILLIITFISLAAIIAVLTLIICRVHRYHKQQYAHQQEFYRVIQMHKDNQT